MAVAELPKLDAENTAILAEMECRRLAGELDAAGLLALSDLYDDAGDLDMAAFCRYMPESPRVPDDFSNDGGDCDNPFMWWKWTSRNDNKGVVGDLIYDLHGDAVDVYTLGVGYPTREAAERDLGRVLRELGVS